MEISLKGGATIQRLAPVEAKARRGQIEILLKILTLTTRSCTSKGATKTHLAYGSGLNFRRLERYLDLLMQRRLIELVDSDEKDGTAGIYRITKSGERAYMLLFEAEKIIFDDNLDQREAPSLEDRW